MLFTVCVAVGRLAQYRPLWCSMHFTGGEEGKMEAKNRSPCYCKLFDRFILLMWCRGTVDVL